MRLQYCTQYRDEQWARTIFVDKKIFAITRGGRVIWLEAGVPRPEHRVDDVHIRIHVWGAIWYQGKSDLVTVEGRMNADQYG